MLLAVAVAAGAGGCRPEPLRVGFVSGLSGRHSDLGISSRNGVTLAVEELNAAGGIGGRPVELVVRDDAQDPEIARRAVEDLAGYRVIEAEDGEDALRKFRERPGEVALCLLDVVMPRLNGRDAAEAIAAERPGARILLASGYAADVLQTRGLAPGVDLVPKPIAPADLLRRVREALDRPAGPVAVA